MILQCTEIYFVGNVVTLELGCRSQWLLALRPGLSSPAQTLASWVRIPLKAWMSVCVYFVFVL
jgi:hypothetical protein